MFVYETLVCAWAHPAHPTHINHSKSTIRWSSIIKTWNTQYAAHSRNKSLSLHNSTHKCVKLTIPFNDSSLVTTVTCSVPTQHNSLSRKFHDLRTYTDVNCYIPYIAPVSITEDKFHMR